MRVNNQKSSILLVIGIFVLIGVIGGLTFAFFNYTRTGNANTFKVGRISFVSRQEETINLTNLFPIASSAVDTDTDNVGLFEIEIEGDTDYSGGIEYLVSIVDANIYSSGKTVPISLDVTVNNLGTESDNYFTARENTNTSIYKKLVGNTIVGDGMLLVGYIKPNAVTGTIEGIDGSITIKAYIDEELIGISDTYDGTESDYNGTTEEWVNGRTIFTTSEWNALQTTGISFKVKVEANEGIWVVGSLEEIMKKTAVMDNINSTYVNNQTPGIDFGKVSSDTNGKGVYIRSGTENEENPIMYYRGDVDDNNIVFANKCWKAVRTTETGGVKLLYNGELSYNKRELVLNSDINIVSNVGNFSYNSSDNSLNATITESADFSNKKEILSFNVLENGNYYLDLTAVVPDWIVLFVLNNSDELEYVYTDSGEELYFKTYLENLSSNDIIKILYTGDADNQSSSTVKIKLLKEDASLGTSCDNNGSASLISLDESGIETNKFSYAGDENNASLAYVGYMYGNDYKILFRSGSTTNMKFGSGFEYNNGTYTLTGVGNNFANTRHYTCLNNTGICDNTIYYFLEISGFMIELEDEKTIEDALIEMNENINDSIAKTKVDEWYRNNMLSETNKIEDTIYCNDRSISTYGGYNPNGGNGSLYFSPSERLDNGTPSLVCAVNDSFTVNNVNGNQKLTYPVGLLTVDEMMLSGLTGYSISVNYLNNSSEVWGMSPYNVSQINVGAFSFYRSEGIEYCNTNDKLGLRPMIALKPGMQIKSGTGTTLDPYVIE